MAQAQLDAAIEEALTYYLQQKDKPHLSFVFKIHTTTLHKENQEDTTTLDWKSYTKTPTDDALRQVINNNVQEMELTEQDPSNPTELDDITQRSAACLLGAVQRVLFSYFQYKGWEPESVTWFMQVELSQDTGLHVHLLISHNDLKPTHGKWILKFFSDKFSKIMTHLCTVELSLQDKIQLRQNITFSNWVQVLTYKHPGTKKTYTKPVNGPEIIANYFLRKKPINQLTPYGYIMSTDSGFKVNGQHYGWRIKLASMLARELQQTELTASTSSNLQDIKPQEKKRQRIETQKEVSIKDTVKCLFAARTTSLEDWMLNEPDSYIHLMASAGGETIVKNTLDIVTLQMSRQLTAYQLIREKSKGLPSGIAHFKAYELFSNNGWNPIKCYHAIMCCLNRQSGKRNTILLWGPASTGKSILAQRLAQLVGNVGCYNPANANFPFNDCTNKNLIWVEEAGNFGQQVNQFKAICSGQTIRIDQKGKGSKQIDPTPIVMTTNENITEVRIGCELKPEHTQPIKDRMLSYHMTCRLPGDFGLIPEDEIPCIFHWMEHRGYLPTMANYSHTWNGVPTWAEDWSTPGINTGINMPIEPQSHPSSELGSAHSDSQELVSADAALEELLRLWEKDSQETDRPDEQPQL
nr:MAG: NS1 [Parvovirinae sp.]